MIDFLKEAAGVVPSKRQLAWFDTGFYAFMHFGVNTYTDREWGDGTEDEGIFNPEKLDCRQWARTVRDAGDEGDDTDGQAPRRVLPVALQVHGAQREEFPLQKGRGRGGGPGL